MKDSFSLLFQKLFRHFFRPEAFQTKIQIDVSKWHEATFHFKRKKSSDKRFLPTWNNFFYFARNQLQLQYLANRKLKDQEIPTKWIVNRKVRLTYAFLTCFQMAELFWAKIISLKWEEGLQLLHSFLIFATFLRKGTKMQTWHLINFWSATKSSPIRTKLPRLTPPPVA